MPANAGDSDAAASATTPVSVAQDEAALQAVGARRYMIKGVYGKKDPSLTVLADQFWATLNTFDRVREYGHALLSKIEVPV